MTITEPRYFHLMPPGEWKRLCAEGTTWRGLQHMGYAQPDWCSYPDALDGLMGCWSLIYQRVTGEEYCKDCDLYKPKDTP
ncbi:MAG TPA: hypothetical protein DCK83_02135 [Gallionellaceae bacterium]|nr:hypothetical protein [Gallionellaceae bacterium]